MADTDISDSEIREAVARRANATVDVPKLMGATKAVPGIRSPVAIREEERALVVDHLEAKTIALRDAGIAFKRAQEEYRAALDAFNRFVAPEPGQ